MLVATRESCQGNKETRRRDDKVKIRVVDFPLRRHRSFRSSLPGVVDVRRGEKNRRVPVCQNFSLTDAFRQTEKARFGSDVPLCRTRLFRQTRKWMFGIEPPVCRKRTWTDSSDKLVKRYSGRQFLFDGKNISGRLWKLITRRPPELNGKDTWHSTGKLSSERINGYARKRLLLC